MRRRVLCFGNDLHGDDGFGPAVARRLLSAPLPANWEVYEVGTRGLDALWLLEDCAQAILVDAAAPGEQPGTLRWLDVGAVAEGASGDSAHGEGVAHLLRSLRCSGLHSDLSLLTAEMQDARTFDPRLSSPVARSVEQAVAQLQGRMLEPIRPITPITPGSQDGRRAW